jgi:hypothetical protein
MDATPGIKAKYGPPLDLKANATETTRTFVMPSEPSEPSGSRDDNSVLPKSPQSPRAHRVRETHRNANKPTCIARSDMEELPKSQQLTVKVKPSGVSLLLHRSALSSPRLHDGVQDLKADNPQAHRARLDRALGKVPNVRPNLEGDLLALETTAATTAAAESTTAAAESTSATSTAATETSTASSTTSAAATEATTTTTASKAATATSATVGVTGLGVVETDRATLEVTAVELLKSGLGILNRAESNVTKALGTTSFPRILVSMMKVEE